MCMKTIRAISFLLFLLAAPAYAADVTLNWTNATRNDDATPENPEGTLIPTDPTDPNALATTTLYWGACDANDLPIAPLGEMTFPTTVPGAAETAQVVITTPGTWCIVGVHTNNAGQTSKWSTSTIKQVFNVPQPPANLTVAANTVYYVIQRENRFVLLPVGTIPEGTACIGTEYVNGYYAVDRALVTWTGGTQPMVVVAQCSPP